MSQPNPSPDPQTHAVVGMRAMELIVAGLLLAFGLTVAYASYQLGADWAEDGPKAGYFPFYIGLIIAVSSVVTLAQAWLNRTPKSGEAFVERGQLKLVMAVLLPAAAYVLVIQWFGIYAASAIYMAVFMVWLGKYSWAKSLAVAVGVSVMAFLLFEVWFKVPLPKGPLEALLGLQ